MKVGVLATIIFGALIGSPIASFAGLAPDADGDGIPDVLDNCLNVANAGTGLNGNCDTDQDGYGNMCDCDLNNTGGCSPTDLALWKVAFKAAPQTNQNANINCSQEAPANFISPTDLALWKVRFKSAPQQQSGLSCAGTIPCN